MPATCCYLFIYFLLPIFFFLQTLHIYCSHTSHIVSASYSSSGSPGLNHGECLSSDIYGCFFQLARIHVCRENMNWGELCGNGGSNYWTACLWKREIIFGNNCSFCVECGNGVILGVLAYVLYVLTKLQGLEGMHTVIEWWKHLGCPSSSDTGVK